MSGLIEIKSAPCKLSLNLLDGTFGSNLRRPNKLGTEGGGERKGAGLYEGARSDALRCHIWLIVRAMVNTYMKKPHHILYMYVSSQQSWKVGYSVLLIAMLHKLIPGWELEKHPCRSFHNWWFLLNVVEEKYVVFFLLIFKSSESNSLLWCTCKCVKKNGWG